jgi:molybdopterin converting factor subunit 1
MNEVTLLYFATIREIIGKKGETIRIPAEYTVGDVKNLIREKYPQTNPYLVSVIVAVNKEYKSDDEEIPDSAEIALFPPVSGGVDKTWISLMEDEFDLNQVMEKITYPTTGAVCFFTGIVRGKTSRIQPHLTDHLVYEAYPTMAEEKMRQIAVEIRAQWPAVEGIVICQRLGVLKAGTPTVLIACSASHRDTGIFEAARYGIDRLKEVVPVWKKEVGPDGESWVEGDYIPHPGE